MCWLLAAFVTGIAAGNAWGASYIFFVVFIIFYSALAWTIKKNKRAFALPVLIFVCLGWLGGGIHKKPFFPSPQVSKVFDIPCIVRATVQEITSLQKSRKRIILGSISIKKDKKGGFIDYPGKIQCSIYSTLKTDILPGMKIEISCKIKKPRNFENPGGFDYTGYLARKGIWGRVNLKPDAIRVVAVTQKPAACRLLDSIRDHVRSCIQKGAGSRSFPLVYALVLGEKDNLTRQIRDNFAKSGTAHLLAISGLHIGIVAWITFMVFSRIFGISVLLCRKGWAAKASAMAALVFVWVYALMAGFSPSTRRAAIMGTVFLSALILEYEYDLVNTACVAALAILASAPWSLFSPSFQLSFAAVFAIIAGFRLVSKAIPGKTQRAGKTASHATERIKGTACRAALGIFFSTVFATAGCLPLLARYFGSVSLVGIPANIIMVPLVGFAAVPLGLFSSLISFFSPDAASLGFHVTGILLSAALRCTEFFSSLRFSTAEIFRPTWLEILLYYLFFGLVFISIETKKKGANKPTPSGYACTGGNRLNSHAISALIILLIICIDASWWIKERYFNKDLKITIIDVGQGSAALVEFPGSKRWLIDGGGFPDNETFDIGRFVVAPYLKYKKILSIDTLILTHPDTDHANGLFYILDHFRVNRLVANPEKKSRLLYSLVTLAGEHNIRVLSPFGIENGCINGVEITRLHPAPRDFRDSPLAADRPNNRSQVFRFKYGKNSILFCGDIEARAEKLIMERHSGNLESTILVSPHHGSATSSSVSFLDAVSPDTILLSCRKTRRSPPAGKIITRYLKRGCQIYRTDMDGAIFVKITQDSQEITTRIDKSRNTKLSDPILLLDQIRHVF